MRKTSRNENHWFSMSFHCFLLTCHEFLLTFYWLLLSFDWFSMFLLDFSLVFFVHLWFFMDFSLMCIVFLIDFDFLFTHSSCTLLAYFWFFSDCSLIFAILWSVFNRLWNIYLSRCFIAFCWRTFDFHRFVSGFYCLLNGLDRVEIVFHWFLFVPFIFTDSSVIFIVFWLIYS